MNKIFTRGLSASPTPMSRFTTYLDKKDVKELPISVEEAMKIIISCGILVPARDKLVIGGG